MYGLSNDQFHHGSKAGRDIWRFKTLFCPMFFLLRRSRLAYAFHNVVSAGGLAHNLPIYRWLNKRYSPISSRDFAHLSAGPAGSAFGRRLTAVAAFRVAAGQASQASLLL
jgi:hypothetical protein